MSSSTAADKKKGWSNPALQAMGIPRLRLPGRNWLIFWAVTGGLTGMWYYDRRERKARRQYWKDRVAHLATQPMSALELPRKVTVYMAPPPSDYLDITSAHFRQYIKPILVAAAVDYEVKSESRQGEIRNMVAEDIRNKRRKQSGLETSDADKEKLKDELDKKIETGLTRDETGGVIIVGRGAYVEYMNGLQEGWLGPLENPNSEPAPVSTSSDEPAVSTEVTAPVVETLGAIKDTANTTDNATDTPVADELEISSEPIPIVENSANSEDPSAFPDRKADEADVLGYETPKTASEQAEADKKASTPPVPAPYVSFANIEDVPTPFDFPGPDESVSEPLMVMSHRHVLGFLKMPIRIYRFFTRRYLADEMGRRTAAVVFAATREYDLETEKDLLIEERDEDWPKKFKAKCLEKGSEWMWEFNLDKRVADKVKVYELPDEEPLKKED